MIKNNINDDVSVGLKKLTQVKAEAEFEERFFAKLSKMNSLESRFIFSRAFVLCLACFTVYFFITLINNSIIIEKETNSSDTFILNENDIPENMKIGDSYFPTDCANPYYKVFDYSQEEKERLDSLKEKTFSSYEYF